MFDDEFAGQGGTYLLDPKTGKRTRIEETIPDVVPANPTKPAVEPIAVVSNTKASVEPAITKGI